MWERYHPSPMPRPAQEKTMRPMIHIHIDSRFALLCVLRSHALCFCELGFRLSSLATILNRLQKSSPFSPRRGRSFSSEFPRIIVSGPHLMSLDSEGFDGRAKTGRIGVMVGGRGWGALGTEIGATGGCSRVTAGGTRAVPYWSESIPGGERALSDSLDKFRAAIGATYPGFGAARGTGICCGTDWTACVVRA